jgi:hypothetical protein
MAVESMTAIYEFSDPERISSELLFHFISDFETAKESQWYNTEYLYKYKFNPGKLLTQ